MIQVMKKHLANQDIIVHACKALGNLAMNTNNQITIAMDGIAVRIDALVHHSKEKSYSDLETLVFAPFTFFLTLPMMSPGIR